MPELEAARNELGPGGPEFLAIALDDEGDPERLRHIAEAFGYRGGIAVYKDEDGILAPLGVREVPGLAFVNREGVVVSAASGVHGSKFIVKHARALR